MTRPSEIEAAYYQRMVLRETLRLAVPLHMRELEGLQPDTLTAIGKRSAAIVGEKGDVLQYGGHKRGEAADVFNALARGLAAAALTAWGGVRFDGLHWCRTPGCSDPDDIDAHPQPYPDAVKLPPPRRPVEDLPDLSAWGPPA